MLATLVLWLRRRTKAITPAPRREMTVVKLRRWVASLVVRRVWLSTHHAN
jgi:hypothetical protein